ncbi:metalloregulator ArsR/SmtB family transcription factor [Shewanella sp. NIFS-20-20]|uniref:metalloregulator ArsR/SmtB family transcription factor n=1 Tax=Shewanella sp. NIFS-20-20 TaxID=2853806 RepID=UPI001C494908|nr:metalloregulator ArsR/SmtB family transcription factor [Shewanella sp. NIFS-20-20]MBV7317197.1 metalloregulator ArsR/SmtB family transcription factor [Shewanella sp. NIFS-20-20]
MLALTFFKALADETRLHTLLLIASQQELCVCELMVALGQSQPKISRHLALLRQEGILCDRRQGQWIFYRLNPELPSWATSIIATSLGHHQTLIAPAQQRLRHMGDRPERQQACCGSPT